MNGHKRVGHCGVYYDRFVFLLFILDVVDRIAIGESTINTETVPQMSRRKIRSFFGLIVIVIYAVTSRRLQESCTKLSKDFFFNFVTFFFQGKSDIIQWLSDVHFPQTFNIGHNI